MFNKPINAQLSTKLDLILSKAIVKAEDYYQQFKNELEAIKDPVSRFRLLFDEYYALEEYIDNNEFRFYIDHYYCKDWLLNQFASRYFVLNVDDSVNLENAIIDGAYNAMIVELFRTESKKLPKYTAEDFFAGRQCPYFRNFALVVLDGDDAFFAIHTWRIENLVSLLEYEVVQYIKAVQNECLLQVDPLNFINQQKKLIEELEDVEPNAQALKKHLRKMFWFKDLQVSNLDDELLVESFGSYLNGEVTYNQMFPGYIDPFLKLVKNESKQPLGCSSTIFLVVSKVSRWFDSIDEVDSIQKPVDIVDWEKAFLQLLLKSVYDQEAYISSMHDQFTILKWDRDKIKRLLIDCFDSLRVRFNEFTSKNLFGMVDPELRGTLLAVFMERAFLYSDIDEASRTIEEALFIHDVSWALNVMHMMFAELQPLQYPEQNISHVEVIHLLNHMVLDKDLYSALVTIIQNAKSGCRIYEVPQQMNFHNNRVELANLFHVALNKLSDHLDNAFQPNKVLFLQSRLKQLRHRLLELGQMDKFYSGECLYPNLFKEFLEIESDFIANIKEYAEAQVLCIEPDSTSKSPPLLTLQSPEHQDQNINFEMAFSGSKSSFVCQMLEDLSLTSNGIAVVSQRKKGAIRGVADALKEKHVAPAITITQLTSILAEKIQLDVKSLDTSKISERYRKLAIEYIQNNFSEN